MTNVALEVESPLGYDDTVDASREFLAAEGFGVLTEIDLARTLKAKLDVDRDPYVRALASDISTRLGRVLDAVRGAE